MTMPGSLTFNDAILMFEFTDREPVRLALPQAEAEKMAQAIFDQGKNPPPPPGSLN
jgi:hypothetical protein